jgi:hypothetical protein
MPPSSRPFSILQAVLIISAGYRELDGSALVLTWLLLHFLCGPFSPSFPSCPSPLKLSMYGSGGRVAYLFDAYAFEEDIALDAFKRLLESVRKVD